MKILALNCGSSSLKYQLWDITKNEVMVKGEVDRIGLNSSNIKHKIGLETKTITKTIQNHEEAVAIVVGFLDDSGVCDLSEIKGVGHRVVQGGSFFKESALITAETIEKIEELSPLAPLHNPANVIGIKSAKKVLPKAIHVAVFDTTFHQTMPKHIHTYALPREILDKYPDLRRYGFHGSSHRFVTEETMKALKNPTANIVTMHIGNGISFAAMKDGKAYDTSMGLTPLEGVVMGTRSGSIDPTVIKYICEKESKSIGEVITLLNKESGLLGISGKFSDHRDILNGIKENDENCQLANDIYEYSMRKQLGAYMFALGKVDAIVFTAGVGENCTTIRENICKDLTTYGIEIDVVKNKQIRGEFAEISTSKSNVKVFVVPTNEEYIMVRDTVSFLDK